MCRRHDTREMRGRSLWTLYLSCDRVAKQNSKANLQSGAIAFLAAHLLLVDRYKLGCALHYQKYVRKCDRLG